MTSPTAAGYERFAALEARGVSPRFEEWAAAIAADPDVLSLIDGLPRPKRQPNLVFAAARLAGAPLAPYPQFRSWLLEHWSAVEPVIQMRMTQTNEAGRCAVLLPLLSGFEGPVALIEAGAAAGICLYPDRYSYSYQHDGGETVLHPASGPSPVQLTCALTGAAAPTQLPDVVWRAGIDLNPLDVQDPEDMAWLETLIWPEHQERRDRLEAVVKIAASEPPHLVRGDIVNELPALVDKAPKDATVVVFHSAVLPYVEPDHRQRSVDLVQELNVTWISNEGEGVLPEIKSQLPRSAEGRLVLSLDGRPQAFTGPHGQSYEAPVWSCGLGAGRMAGCR
ncbi:DUF2332 domain-containing protein [Arthrobacter gandavensis]|uniref:DUF2332 domain-containing protein n=1 Tax=Arthrobacter gandavensis TaxID=169960 RepID=UPI00188E026D|nr:DUF2332 domain-containing protein [Arthrobacter gandavensis]MBF4992753.1 DUF2332 domain-containing protein [Arthrobacter gandavensis]